VWLSGLAALDQGEVLAAQASFNTVYGQVPGELAPKLALAVACEASGELDVAESLYLVCAATDAAYTSPAAFGLARLRRQRGDTDGALTALALVSPTRASHSQAQAMRAQLLADLAPTTRPAPVERPTRSRRQSVESLHGLADYQPRTPSTADEVATECARIAKKHGEGWLVTGDLVQLSGIDWRVLDVVADESGCRALLLADRVVGTAKYHRADVPVTWAKCDLRGWLNDEFLSSLGDPLVSRVMEMMVRNGPNPIWETSGGEYTQDQVFLLSIEEAVSFLVGQKNVEWERYKNGGWFTDQRLALMGETGKAAWWWLRSPGRNPDCAAYVFASGRVYDLGSTVSASSVGVRPAFWLNLESSEVSGTTVQEGKRSRIVGWGTVDTQVGELTTELSVPAVQQEEAHLHDPPWGSREAGRGHAEHTPTSATEPAVVVGARSAAPPRRLGKLVDYQSRTPSTADEVAAECSRVTRAYPKDWSADCDLVRLSGIDWRVLDVSGRRALLLADRVIGTGLYHRAQVPVRWSECDLRPWLNGEFLASLGDPLASRVLLTTVPNKPNPVWETGGDRNTADRVFLLSMEEAASFLAGKKKVRWKKKYKGGECFTDQALSALDEGGALAWWWLRSPGLTPDGAAYVGTGGYVFDGGSPVSAADGGVRPVFWLNLSS
jgi:hypothetical protein